MGDIIKNRLFKVSLERARKDTHSVDTTGLHIWLKSHGKHWWADIYDSNSTKVLAYEYNLDDIGLIELFCGDEDII